MAEQQVEQHLAVGGALAVAVVAIGDHCLQAPAQALIAADLAVVHEHPAAVAERMAVGARRRSEENTSELQSLMRISYAVFCLKKKTKKNIMTTNYEDRKKRTTRKYTIK